MMDPQEFFFFYSFTLLRSRDHLQTSYSSYFVTPRDYLSGWVHRTDSKYRDFSSELRQVFWDSKTLWSDVGVLRQQLSSVRLTRYPSLPSPLSPSPLPYLLPPAPVPLLRSGSSVPPPLCPPQHRPERQVTSIGEDIPSFRDPHSGPELGW